MNNNKEENKIIENYLTPKEIEERLQLSHGTVNKLIHSNAFATIRIGKCIRIKAKDFEEFLQNYENKTYNL